MTSRTRPRPAAAIADALPGGSPAAALPPAFDRGATAREHLLAHATRIFAAKGFAAASTREICEAAGVNVASIHFYFGDKVGLYRAVLLRPIAEMSAGFGAFDDPALTFEQTMRMFLAPFLHLQGEAEAGDGADAEREMQVMKLHLREMLEPSAVFREITAQAIAPIHQALSGVIAGHCGLAAADDDIHQLAFALVAMANDYCMSREFMKMLAPGVLDRPKANELILDRLVGYSRALLDHEIARRRPAHPPAAARRPTRKEKPDARTTAPARTARAPTRTRRSAGKRTR